MRVSAYYYRVLAGFMGYCAALVHWAETIATSNLTQAILEAATLVLYTCLGIRFCHRKINFF